MTSPKQRLRDELLALHLSDCALRAYNDICDCGKGSTIDRAIIIIATYYAQKTQENTTKTLQELLEYARTQTS